MALEGQFSSVRSAEARDGCWEAIPIEKAGDYFKLRWRDHASLPPISRSRLDLALIYPNAA